MWSKFKAAIFGSLRFDEEIASYPRPNRIDRVMAQPTLIKGPLSPCIGMLCDKDIISWMKCCSMYYKTFLMHIPLAKHSECSVSKHFDLERPPASLVRVKRLIFYPKNTIWESGFEKLVACTPSVEQVICLLAIHLVTHSGLLQSDRKDMAQIK